MVDGVNVPKNIVLIGFMGCGKSTVGRELQQRLGYPLVDMDALIEQRSGKAIATLFSELGEPAFRDMETQLPLNATSAWQPAGRCLADVLLLRSPGACSGYVQAALLAVPPATKLVGTGA